MDKKVITKNRKIIGKILTPIHPLNIIGKVKINKSKGKKVGYENHLEDTSQKNDSRDQTGQSNSSNETRDVVPSEIESSSSESDLVVPGSQVSSSPENTINTKKNSLKNSTNNSTTGPIQEVDQIVANSFSISKRLFNSPEAIKIFEDSLLEYSNEYNYPYSMISYLLKNDLKILGNWEEKLLQTGIEKFIHDMGNYHNGDPKEIAFVYVFAIRTLNREQSE